MATQKAMKLKDDAHRKLLEEGISKLLLQQEQIFDLLRTVAMTVEKPVPANSKGVKRERPTKQVSKRE